MGAELVRKIVVQAVGDTDQLDASLKKAGTSVTRFKQLNATAADGASELSERYARAGRSIAGASVEMAHMGEVGVKSAREVVKTASEVAFAFGPEGAIAGAIGFSVLAIVAFFKRASDEQKKLVAESKKAADDLQNAGDRAGILAQMNKLFVGEPSAGAAGETGFGTFFKGSLTDLQTQLTKAENDFRTAATRLAQIPIQATIDKLREQIAPIQAQYDDLERRLNAPGPRGATGVLAPVGVTADTRQGANWMDAALEAQKKGEEILREDRLRALAELAQFQTQFAQALARSTATLTDDITLEFDVMIKRAHDLGQASAEIKLTALRDSAVETQRFLEGVANDLKVLENSNADQYDTFVKLDGLIQRTLGELTDTTLSDSDRARLNAELDELYKRQAAAVKDVARATGAVDSTTADLIEKARTHAQVLQQAVDGGLQLAAAFGLIDERAENILRSVGQIATGVGPLGAALQGGNAASIAGAALPVVGAIATFVTALADHGRAEREAQAAAVKALTSLTQELTAKREQDAANPFEREQLQAQQDQARQFQQIVDDLKAAGITLTPAALAQGPRALANTLGSPNRFGGSGSDDPRIAAAIAALNALADSADETAQRLKETAAAAAHDLGEDIEARRARVRGEDDLAEQLTLRNRLEAEYNEKKASGLYTESQLADLQELQAEELAKFIQDQADAHAKEIAQATGDAQTRIDIATAANDREAELDRRRAQQAQELANVTDPSVRALIEFAQAAENAAAAADQLAATQRGLEDLEVRDLRAKGQTDAADLLAFKEAQQREAEDAKKRGETQDYLDQLAKTQADELTKFIADHASGATPDLAGGGGGAAAATPASATSSVLERGTVPQFDRVIALEQTQVAIAQEDLVIAKQMLALMSLGRGVITPPSLPAFGFGAGSTVSIGPPQITVNVYGDAFGGNPQRGGELLSEALYRAIVRRMARDMQDQRRATGGDGVVS